MFQSALFPCRKHAAWHDGTVWQRERLSLINHNSGHIQIACRPNYVLWWWERSCSPAICGTNCMNMFPLVKKYSAVIMVMWLDLLMQQQVRVSKTSNTFKKIISVLYIPDSSPHLFPLCHLKREQRRSGGWGERLVEASFNLIQSHRWIVIEDRGEVKALTTSAALTEIYFWNWNTH